MVRWASCRRAWIHGSNCRFSDPVNLLFDQVDDLDELVRVFVRFDATQLGHWTGPNVLDRTKMHLFERTNCTSQQDDELQTGDFFGVRYHVRFWHKVEYTKVIAAAHMEQFAWVTHEVLSFDEPARVIAGQFESAGFQVWRNCDDLRNATDSPRNDGFLDLIGIK
jgi:hypothetical protein